MFGNCPNLILRPNSNCYILCCVLERRHFMATSALWQFPLSFATTSNFTVCDSLWFAKNLMLISLQWLNSFTVFQVDWKYSMPKVVIPIYFCTNRIEVFLTCVFLDPQLIELERNFTSQSSIALNLLKFASIFVCSRQTQKY